MTKAILEWLGGNDTGSSSKTIALTALGAMPAGAAHKYPSDTNDFGRCYRLIEKAAEARDGLEALGVQGGPYWKALVENWPALEAAYLRDLMSKGDETYELMRSILRPIEAKDSGVVRLSEGVSIRFGR